jgi:hypothetical protein
MAACRVLFYYPSDFAGDRPPETMFVKHRQNRRWRASQKNRRSIHARCVNLPQSLRTFVDALAVRCSSKNRCATCATAVRCYAVGIERRIYVMPARGGRVTWCERKFTVGCKVSRVSGRCRASADVRARWLPLIGWLGLPCACCCDGRHSTSERSERAMAVRPAARDV